MFLNYFALGVLIFVFLVLFYGIIMIHDIPYNIAKKRNHPHADAIHTAGWVSLFTLHVIWPFLWIWATLYQPDRGWGMQSHIPLQNPSQPAMTRFSGFLKGSPSLNKSSRKYAPPPTRLRSNNHGSADCFDLRRARVGGI